MNFASVRIWLLLSYTIISLHAENSTNISSEAVSTYAANVTQQIDQELQQFTLAATETKVNEPYQPYIISVLTGKELEKLGVSTLQEALQLIPGVDFSADLSDAQTPIFRGSNPFAFGQVKLLIDGMLANDIFTDGFIGYLYMPIELVKRIEVVRGPGSRTDGINAYAGSIQIITYAEEIGEPVNRVFAKAGSFNQLVGGFTSSFSEEKFRFHADGYYHKDDKTLFAGPDAAATGAYNFGPIDNSSFTLSGQVPLQTTTYALGVQLDYDTFTLKARGTNFSHGSAYGINALLPQNEDRIQMPAYMLELDWNEYFGNLEAIVKVGMKQEQFSSDARLISPGITLPNSDNTGVVTYADGFFGIHEADQRSFYQSTYFKYRGFENHTITTGYRISRDETYNVITKTTDRDSDSGTNLVDYSETLPFFDVNAQRDTLMFSLQDQMEVGRSLSLLYGINIEKTSLTDTQYDPRISLVYQQDIQRIFKAIYSRSHRNPSWQELFTINNSARVGNTNLDPETVEAFELAFIEKFNVNSYLQADIFYLINKDQIDKNNAQHIYLNNHNTNIYGLELEVSTSLLENDQLYANYSYVDGSDEDGNPLANVAHHLAKASYLYRFTPELNVGTILNYVGQKTRAEGDDRSDTPSYFTADFDLRYYSYANRFSVTGSVKNIADADVYYPSEPDTYVNDYQQEGRTFLITVSKEF